MIIEVEGLVKTSQIIYTKITSYIYGSPMTVEVGVMTLSTNDTKQGQTYKLIKRDGTELSLVYIGIAEDPIAEDQKTTQLVFVPMFYYQLLMKSFQREDSLFFVKFDKYIPFSNQRDFFLLQMRLESRIFVSNGVKQAIEYKGLVGILLTQPTKVKRVSVGDKMKRYSLLNQKVSDGATTPILWIDEDVEFVDGLNRYIIPKWELEFKDLDKNIKLGDCVLFMGQKYIAMEINSFYKQTKTANLLILGELK